MRVESLIFGQAEYFFKSLWNKFLFIFKVNYKPNPPTCKFQTENNFIQSAGQNVIGILTY